MLIGFANGDYYRLFDDDLQRYDPRIIEMYHCAGGARAIELHCNNQAMLDYLVQQNIDVSMFDYCSLHSPDLPYGKDPQSLKALDAMTKICQRYPIKNIVFHVDKIVDRSVFELYKDLPLSIENMDDLKKSGQTFEEIKILLDRYPFFGLTLDVQHAYVNDQTMSIAQQLQDHYADRIVEYHLSGYAQPYLHHPLVQTQQQSIIESVIYTDKPIIIESTFDHRGDHQSEFDYCMQYFIRKQTP